jgi:hypothetical protein
MKVAVSSQLSGLSHQVSVLTNSDALSAPVECRPSGVISHQLMADN